MDQGTYQRVEGELIRGAAGLLLLARNGMVWQLGILQDAAHLVGKLVAVEGIKSGVEALNVSFVEALSAVPWREGRQRPAQLLV
jgi:hypothetical protein